MNYEKLKAQPQVFEGLTSLRPTEFDELVPHFEQVYLQQVRKATTRGTPRKNKLPDDQALPTSAHKLFFITTYLKLNPTQIHHGASFDISQAKVSRLLRLLLEVFNLTLYQLGYMPCRDASDYASFIDRRRTMGQEEHHILDASERPIQRPNNQQDREDYYSQKKTPFDKEHLH